MGPSRDLKSNIETDQRFTVVQSALRLSILADTTVAQRLATQRVDRKPQDARYNDDKPQTAGGWYSGTWPRSSKADAVTKVATEKATAAHSSVSSIAANPNAHPSLTSVLKNAGASLSRQATTSSNFPPPAIHSKTPTVNSNETGYGNGPAISQDTPNVQHVEQAQDMKQQMESIACCEQSLDLDVDRSSSSNEAAGWSAWFGKVNKARSAAVKHDAQRQGCHGDGSNISTDVGTDLPQTHGKRRSSEPETLLSQTTSETQPKAWFASWSRARTNDISGVNKTVYTDSAVDVDRPKQCQSPSVVVETTQAPGRTGHLAKPYGWAFWSRDSAHGILDNAGLPDENSKLTFPGMSSQPLSVGAPPKTLSDASSNIGGRWRPHSMQASTVISNPLNSKQPRSDPKYDISTITEPAQGHGNAMQTSGEPNSLVLPSFRSTYHPAERQGLIHQLSRMLSLGSSSCPKHIEVSNPRRINKALAIGIHGYFPAPLIRSVLGQPTGTSIRFAHGAATAIKKWTQHLGYSCKVEEVALEGEGKISERIELLWKLMLNHMDQIRTADFILIASHSQASPISVMLVAKLIALGCVDTARIGLCAMAGINLGPFAQYKSRWISGAAGELFDFANPESRVSRDYDAALDVALRFGVRIVYVGSIDDQLVSLEVSCFYLHTGDAGFH